MHLQADWYRQREEKSALLSGCSCLWPADMERVEIHQSHSGRSLKFVCVCFYESVRLCLSVLKCADLCITLYECVQYVSGCSPAGMRACMHTHLHESSRAWGGVNPSECMNVICEKMQFCLWVVFHTCVWVYAFKCRYCECWSFIFIHTLVPYGFFLFFFFFRGTQVRWCNKNNSNCFDPFQSTHEFFTQKSSDSLSEREITRVGHFIRWTSSIFH